MRGLLSLLKPAKPVQPPIFEPVFQKMEWESVGKQSRHMRDIFEDEFQALKSISMLSSAVSEAGDEARRIAFVSSEGGMAASAMTISLGRLLSYTNMRVAALDFAINEPFLSQLLDEEAFGLTNAINEDCAMSDALYGDDKSTLNLIPVGTRRMTIEALLSNRALLPILEALDLAYDRLLLDFGAMNSRFHADKIASFAPYIIIIGNGDDKHRKMIDQYRRYSDKCEIAVMMADAPHEERLAA
jgi:Mrp family chromosome partitioning ATPase